MSIAVSSFRLNKKKFIHIYDYVTNSFSCHLISVLFTGIKFSYTYGPEPYSLFWEFLNSYTTDGMCLLLTVAIPNLLIHWNTVTMWHSHITTIFLFSSILIHFPKCKPMHCKNINLLLRIGNTQGKKKVWQHYISLNTTAHNYRLINLRSTIPSNRFPGQRRISRP